MQTIKVGTRQSALAVTQTNQVIDMLRAICERHGLEYDFQVVKIVTKGDRILDVTLSKVGGKGLFVKEIEQALLDGEVDMAVHSMKDMPAELPDELTVGAVPARVDARDCLISRGGVKFEELPRGAKIGTSSLRRACQLLHYRPDLRMESIRGNIDSRLRKLESEGFDAILLAAAGLSRIGWEDRISERLSTDICLPAVGQGALGIECRADRDDVMSLLALLNDTPTQLAVTAERTFLARLNGGCQVPIGAYAELVSNGAHEARGLGAVNGSIGDSGTAVSSPLLRITGMVGTPDGQRLLKESLTDTDPVQLGNRLADSLIALGADRILAEVKE